MPRKLVVALSLVILCIMCCGSTQMLYASQNEEFASLTLRISSTQTMYLLGEPVNIEIRLSNETPTPVMGHKKIDPAFGFTRLMIAYGGNEFKEYVGPGWGIKDTRVNPIHIPPGEAISQSTTLLYNHKSTLPDEIQTALAFPVPGHYLLKAEFYSLDLQNKIESQTLEIDVFEPQGIDAAAWELIKSEEAIYFLHTGYPKGNPEIVKEFERLLEVYPQSRYTQYVEEALVRFRLGN